MTSQEHRRRGSPRAVAGRNAFFADIEDRHLLQRAPVPADFPRVGRPLSAQQAGPEIEGLGQLVEALAPGPVIGAMVEEMKRTGLIWVCAACGAETMSGRGVCRCGAQRDDAWPHESG